MTANDVTLWATDLPPNQFGIMLASRSIGLIVQPGGSLGNLCLALPIGRFPVESTGVIGEIATTIDLTSMPAPLQQTVAAGEPWFFQCWHRDVGGTSNFTDGETVVFR